MELIVDINIAPYVFSDSPGHYIKLRNCITTPTNKAILIYGGEKFLREYRNIIIQNRSLFVELQRRGKIKVLDKNVINDEEKRLKTIAPEKDFDDEHIIACILHSNCKLVCTDDKRMDKYIKDKNRLFSKKPRRVKIYRYPITQDSLLP
jgi:rRNA-processing protein FCF1